MVRIEQTDACVESDDEARKARKATFPTVMYILSDSYSYLITQMCRYIYIYIYIYIIYIIYSLCTQIVTPGNKSVQMCRHC